MMKHVESGVPALINEDEDLVSEPAGDQHPSQPEQALDAHISALIQKEIDRRFQSAKDKRWAQLERQYGELSQLTEQRSSTPGEVESAGHGMFERLHKLVARAGLANDPRLVAALQRDELSDDLEGYLSLLEDLADLVLDQAARQAPTAASVIQAGEGQAPLPDLRQSYEARKRKLRPGDVDGLTALKREFRGKGMQIY